MKFKHVLVTGGTGYVGSLLVPQLIDLGYKVTAYDTMYFGDERLFKAHSALKCIRGDIRDTDKLFEAMAGVDAVVNLACISNDASFELDEQLSTTINLDAFEPMVLSAKKAGVTYDKDIKPIFEKSCVKCHGGEKPKGKYTMESLQGVLKGGGDAADKVIVKGDSAKSILVHYVSDLVEEYEMPPVDKRDKYPKLTKDEVALVRAWIDQGAK